ncbi:MAG: hypothetical protein IPM51_11595 [Sphingobacteriaceae bacterium]|nr:hypothetical protein [Sphingobacteriaceae bacterium]
MDDAGTIILVNEPEDLYVSPDGSGISKIKLKYQFAVTSGNEIIFILDYTDEDNYIYCLFKVDEKEIEFRIIEATVDSQIALSPLKKAHTTSPDYNYHFNQFTDTYSNLNLDAHEYIFEFRVIHNPSVLTEGTIPPGVNISLHIYDLVDEKEIFVPTYLHPDGAYVFGKTQGVGTSTNHTGTVTVTELFFTGYDYLNFLDINSVCVFDHCSFCGHISVRDLGDWSQYTSDPDTSPISYISTYNAQIRLCAISVVTGSPTFTAEYIQFSSGDFIIFEENDPQYFELHEFLIKLFTKFIYNPPIGNNQRFDFEFDLVFGYFDINNFYYIKFKYVVATNTFTLNIYRKNAGVDSLIYGNLETFYPLNFINQISVNLKFVRDELIEGICFITVSDYSSVYIDATYKGADGQTDFYLGINSNFAPRLTFLNDIFYQPHAPITLWTYQLTANNASTNLPIKLPSDITGGKYGLRAVTIPTHESTFCKLLGANFRRQDFSCMINDWWDFCTSRLPPKGYSITISGLTGNEAISNGTYILNRGFNYPTFDFLSYDNLSCVFFNQEFEFYKELDGQIYGAHFELKIAITNFTATQLTVNYNLKFGATNHCYSKTETYDFLSLDCEATNITLNKNTFNISSVLGSNYGTKMPSTLTAIPIS